MSDQKLTDKERALLEATRREVAANAARREAVEPGGLADSMPHSAPHSAPHRDSGAAHEGSGAAHARSSPPAAAPAPPQSEDAKWARIAALMEAERLEGEERRRKLRRGTIIFLAVVLVLVLFASVRLLGR